MELRLVDYLALSSSLDHMPFRSITPPYQFRHITFIPLVGLFLYARAHCSEKTTLFCFPHALVCMQLPESANLLWFVIIGRVI